MDGRSAIGGALFGGVSLLVALLMARVPAAAAEAQLLVRGKWKTTPARTVAGLTGFRPDKVRLSPYGGWAGRKTKATGFFHVRKIDGRWWMVDPAGCLFLTAGICSVNDSAVDRDALRRKYANDTKWALATGAMLKSSGFNSLGCWSHWRAFRPTPQRMPYFPRWNFLSTYKNRRDAKCGERGYPHQCPPVFDPAFETFCDRHARQLAATKDDPWLVGHFSDNELPFRPDLLEYYHRLPKTDPGHQAAAAWWARRRGGKKREMTRADRAAFLQVVAHRYYSTVSKAIKKYDPNHLYVGSRVHGRTICEPVFRGASPVDVMSVNYYHRWSAEQDRLRNWVKWSGRPVLVSEWYAQSLASAKTPASGAGFRVKTDRGRGLFYQNLTLGLIENRGCVGWHWFKYGGDGEGFHKGIVSRDLQPHTELLDVMKQLNGQVYPLTTYFDRRK